MSRKRSGFSGNLCFLCGRQCVPAKDNLGQPYMGCPVCRVNLEPVTPRQPQPMTDVAHNLATLHARGAVILLPDGDELALTPEAIDAHLTNYAERCQEAADEAYYGGDGPPGCYGPDDTRGT